MFFSSKSKVHWQVYTMNKQCISETARPTLQSVTTEYKPREKEHDSVLFPSFIGPARYLIKGNQLLQWTFIFVH